MKTLADEIYLSEALDSLARCTTESELVAWDSAYCSNEKYMHLPTDAVERLESEYLKRIQLVLGGLA